MLYIYVDVVEVNYFGCGSWYPAVVISVVLAEGADSCVGNKGNVISYNIQYDGETEIHNVIPSYVRVIGGENAHDGETVVAEVIESAYTEYHSKGEDNTPKPVVRNRHRSPIVDPQSLTGDEEVPLKVHEILAALGELNRRISKEGFIQSFCCDKTCGPKGENFPSDKADAITCHRDQAVYYFTRAAEEANKIGKTNIAMKYTDKAEALME
jgi:hypothetical protein